MSISRRLLTVTLVLVVQTALLALLLAEPAWLAGLFRSGGHETLPSPDRLERIVDEVRLAQTERWLAQAERIAGYDASMAVLEQDLRGRLSAVQDPGYLTELERFATTMQGWTQPTQSAGLAGAYERVRLAEQAMGNRLIIVMALRNALLQPGSIRAVEAVELVRVVPPDRPTAESALDLQVRDGEALAAFRAAVLAGDSEVAAMTRHAGRLLERARSEDAVDRSGAFALIAIDGGGSDRGRTLLPDELDLTGGGSGLGNFPVAPGRILCATPEDPATALYSLFVDRWYVMGPFPNTQRRNLDASFLPESGVDLDAITRGKHGRELRWEYWRRDQVRIEPEWAEPESVYYGWSEIRVAEGGRYHLSLGSDDYGKLWVNGIEVWTSRRDRKAFDAGEGTIEVDLDEGVNQILFRCENAGGTMGWSVILHPWKA